MKNLIPILILSLFVSGELTQAEPTVTMTSLQSDLKELKDAVKELRQIVVSQQDRIAVLESENKALRTGAMTTPYPAAPPSAATPLGLGAFNPEIGVVGDITGISTESKEDEDGNDRISVRELEVVFGHDVDPFSRFDATLAISDFENLEIEEAYLSHWGLPADLTGRLGRLRPKIGKAAALHRDSLDTVDEPLVVQEYIGSEGLSRTGTDLSWFVPYDSEIFIQQITAGFLEGGIGEGGTLFGETERRPTFYAHLKNFYELSDRNNIELGGTYLLGSSDEDSSSEVNAFGVDLTYIHHVTPINKFKFQSEGYFQNRDEGALIDDGSDIAAEFDSSPFGFYSLVDYRIAQRWGAGLRYDFVEPVNLSSEQTRDETQGFSAYITFYQSEFARFRAQYERVNTLDGLDDDRFFFQATTAIGVHKHQLQ